MAKVHVDIILERNAQATISEMKELCGSHLTNINAQPGTSVKEFPEDSLFPHVGVIELFINECDNVADPINYTDDSIVWHIYNLDNLGPQADTLSDANGVCVNVATDCILPSACLHTLWENLIYDHNIKEELLEYAEAIMAFSQRGVNLNIINCNKVILLHGPPGTGKTSLCRALAQKLSIRMSSTYKRSILIEINSHNLFSKWFSESGKLVNKMFEHIREVCEMNNTLVCVLIDEVESLAHAREQCLNGNEPSDSFKVVNAVLTQIDNLKQYRNVLLLTTSNIMCAIDLAFVDRADFKQFIGPPNVKAIKRIYMSCIQELIRVGIVYIDKETYESINSCEFEESLTKISESSLSLSARMLRKLPLLACASNLREQHVSLSGFMVAMSKKIENEFIQRGKLLNGEGAKFCNGE